MAWTAPRTWTTGELVTAAIMNTHIRDNQLTLNWTTWSPSYSNITVGSGTVTSRYMHVGGSGGTVIAFWQFTFGSGSAYGNAGGEFVSVPVAPAAHYVDAKGTVGQGVFSDANGSTFLSLVRFNDTLSDFDIVLADTSSAVGVIQSAVTATDPFTFATGDIINFTAVYEAA